MHGRWRRLAPRSRDRSSRCTSDTRWPSAGSPTSPGPCHVNYFVIKHSPIVIHLLIKRLTWPSVDFSTSRGQYQRNKYINKCLKWPSADFPTSLGPCQRNSYINKGLNWPSGWLSHPLGSLSKKVNYYKTLHHPSGPCKINSFINKTLNCQLTLPPEVPNFSKTRTCKIVLTTFWNRQLLPPSVLLLSKISAKEE